jgi:hypothetical protein
MLPASDLAEIISNLATLQLAPDTTAAVLGAVLAPLLRSSQPELPPPVIRETPARRSKPRRQKRKKSRPLLAASGEPTDGPRERALAALKANPDAPLSTIAKLARCARSTAVNARDDLRKEARKEARKPRNAAATSVLAKQNERRERAQRFLKDALADGPQPVSTVEEAAAKAHIDAQTLTQARGALGVVSSRGDAGAGNTLAVQWSLPG